MTDTNFTVEKTRGPQMAIKMLCIGAGARTVPIIERV